MGNTKKGYLASALPQRAHLTLEKSIDLTNSRYQRGGYKGVGTKSRVIRVIIIGSKGLIQQ